LGICYKTKVQFHSVEYEYQVLPLPFNIFLVTCQKLFAHTCLGLYLGTVSCNIGLFVYFCTSTILFWVPWLSNITWNEEMWCLWLGLSFSRLLWVFYGSIWVWEFISISVKNSMWWTLNWICVLLWVVFNNTNSPDLWTWHLKLKLFSKQKTLSTKWK
jgi:hypothetical protein